MHLDNTCSIDNILNAILSLNITTIFSFVISGEINISKDCSGHFKLIKSWDFNQVKSWIADKIGKPRLNGNRYNFVGSVGPLIEYLSSATGSDRYEDLISCWELLYRN